jgi:predicted RNA-binding protein YlqC (UPF0109 family)
MDNLKKRLAADSAKISLSEAWEIDYWTNELGVSESELERIMGKVGHSVDAVRKELSRKSR